MLVTVHKVASFSYVQKENEILIIGFVGTVRVRNSPRSVLSPSQVARFVYPENCLQLTPVLFNKNFYALPMCCTFDLWAESNAGFVIYLKLWRFFPI